MFKEALLISPKAESYKYKDELIKETLEMAYIAFNKLCKETGVETISCFAEDELSVTVAPKFVDLPFKYLTSLGTADRYQATNWSLFGDNYKNLPVKVCDEALIKKALRRHANKSKKETEAVVTEAMIENEKKDRVRFCMRTVANEYLKTVPFLYFISWTTGWCTFPESEQESNVVRIQHNASTALRLCRYSSIKMSLDQLESILKEVNSCKR